jgi:tetrahydromethanopterin S-methyltransferase subunit E
LTPEELKLKEIARCAKWALIATLFSFGAIAVFTILLDLILEKAISYSIQIAAAIIIGVIVMVISCYFNSVLNAKNTKK